MSSLTCQCSSWARKGCFHLSFDCWMHQSFVGSNGIYQWKKVVHLYHWIDLQPWCHGSKSEWSPTKHIDGHSQPPYLSILNATAVGHEEIAAQPNIKLMQVELFNKLCICQGLKCLQSIPWECTCERGQAHFSLQFDPIDGSSICQDCHQRKSLHGKDKMTASPMCQQLNASN